MDITILLVHSLIFVQTQVTFAQIPIECQNCDCCAGTWNKCNVYSEKCNFGCINGYWGEKCQNKCKYTNCESCARNDGSNCLECNKGVFSTNCGQKCPEGCDRNACEKVYGSCLSCKQGYFGVHCNNSCPKSCQNCNQHGLCSECEPGYLNTNKQCTCRTDICVNNSVVCDSCTNTSYFAIDFKCCLCLLENCASCAKRFDTIICKICKSGYFPHANGHCKSCNSQCVENKCDSSSGRCFQGCTTGYWKNTCDKVCELACLSCNQADGSCTQCKNNTTYGPNCRRECSTTCKHAMCDINGQCTNGCISKRFGKQCENRCEEYCKRKDNTTLCSEKNGMCLYGCENGYRGRYCPQVIGNTDIDNTSETQTSLSAALGSGVAGGIVVLIIIAILAMFCFRKRRRSNGEHHDIHNNNSFQDARRDYDALDTNLREVELNDLKYETLQVTDVRLRDQTTDYSNVSPNANVSIAYENVFGGL